MLSRSDASRERPFSFATHAAIHIATLHTLKYAIAYTPVSANTTSSTRCTGSAT